MFTRWLLLLFLLGPLAFAGDPRGNADLAYVFDKAALPVITVTITTEQWNTMLGYFDQNKNNEEKVWADFRFDKNGKVDTLGKIGFRIRGNLSRKRPEGKKGEMHNPDKPDWRQAHFKLDFRKYNKKQRFHGLRQVNLKFFNNDPTYVHEVYAYDLFQRFGVTNAPLSSYCRLYIQIAQDAQPAYFGVYQMVENIDKQYLRARFEGNHKGDLWKCLHNRNGPADLVTVKPHSVKIGVEDIQLDEKKSVRPSYDLKTNKKHLDKAKARFIAFMEQLNTLEGDAFNTWFAKSFDIDGLLRFLAVNTLVGMWDDYWVNANNYYLYFDQQGRGHFIPYDYDNCLGTSLIVANAGTQNILHWGPRDHSRPLVYRVLQNPVWRQTYLMHITTLIDPSKDLFDAERSKKRIQTWYALIADHIPNDTGDNMAIGDSPAKWAKAPYYRLFSGDDRGLPPAADFFKTRIRFAREQTIDAGGRNQP